MEDLALIVSLMLLTELLFSLTVVTFAVIYRFKRSFKRTTMVLVGVLTIMAGWLMGLSVPMGIPPTVALIVSILFMYIPVRQKK
jgi:uncharacterized membrane protein HdeD (DUF308 family)